jgi:type 1 glutamine amidotransferase
MKTLSLVCAMLALAVSIAQAQSAPSATASAPRFKVLALAESGGHHVEFTKAAKPWLRKCGDENGFGVDYITNTASITEAFLARYRLVLQLDFVPYGWKPEAMTAFKAYIEEGRGGWVGLHHATLLGNFDGYAMWPWFSDFMGTITFKNYIPKFTSGTIRVEDKAHPCMKGVPESFIISREEWYTYDRSPRTNVQVLASVDEASYAPASSVKMGDHPVIWTNPHVAARNVYIFMGHGPDLFENPAFTTILRNAVLWAAQTNSPSPPK